MRAVRLGKALAALLRDALARPALSLFGGCAHGLASAVFNVAFSWSAATQSWWGLGRFYQGVSFAIFQTPLSRFGDTAANSGVLALLATSDLPIGVRTACASAAASVWRIGLTPVDTMKTTMQVQGPAGYKLLMAKVGTSGVSVLWSGAMANFAANFAAS